ncbi:helix-turn-helix domain-containing protein [Pseudonocardia broussonetiae]|uniref:Helix-turn-helix domain-containing protein n=1 Tax=Pseudonocardia broussonetiae TaxID=2736640 RepID=A0A6M6JJA9_9PSEU|nr:helix-turn-helix domain-containing protein [Pseudonocardia broussonetiae]QJY46712.1 helix-turn-helix domain-containing protein [Pseudonocardia broussonetiae]
MTDLTPDPARIRSPADLGRELTLARERAGLTIREVARRTRLLPSTLGGYYTGRHRPPLASMELVLAACGVTDLDAWREALLRLRHGGRRAAPEQPPYPGLAPFEPGDAERFHGRSALTAAVLDGLDAATGPLVVVGASGSGKSSVLRAGVVPALRARPGTAALVRTPGRAPLDVLAAVRDELDPAVRTVLVVDQFEELFAPAVPEHDRAAFVAALADLPAAVVLALRADFYGPALAHPALAAALQHDQVVVGPMTDDELREAITAPAVAAGVDVEEALVALLLADVRDRGPAGALPLLGHALLATWRAGDGLTMTVGGYLGTGGVAGAVAASAEEAFAALGPDREHAVRQLFLRLVTVAPDAVDTRRRIARDELPPTVADTDVDAFVARRLLVVDRDTVEIAHEALLVAWPRLHGWLDADRAGLAARRSLADAARTWREQGRDPHLLLRGVRLAVVVEQVGDDLTRTEAEFLRAGREQEAECEARERRRTTALRALVAALTVLVLVVGALAAHAVVQDGRTAQARDVAVSRQVAVRADALRAEDPALAAQLAVAAFRVAPTPEARSSVLNTTGAPLPTRLPGLSALGSTLAVDDARRILASATGSQVQLWDIDGNGPPRPLGPPVPTSEVAVLALSPDGATLAVGEADGVVLRPVADPSAAVVLDTATVSALAFTADGTLHGAVPGEDVRAWAPGTGAVSSLPGSAGFTALAASGGLVAAGDQTGRVALWPGAVPLSGPGGRVHAVAFGPDGRTLLAGSADRAVHRWDVTDPAAPVAVPALTGATNWVNAVAVSPDGATVAVGGSDGNTRLHDAASGAVTATFPHPAPVTTAAFLDDATVLTGEADGVGHLWAVRGPVLTGFDDAVFALDFDDSGAVLAIGPGSKDDTARLWTVTGAGGAQPLGPALDDPEPGPTVSGSAALTPDGTVLAVGRADGSIRLWDVRDPARPAVLGAPLPGSGALVEHLVISPNGTRLAASGDDALVRTWDITDPSAPRRTASLVAATNYVFASAFSPDGRLLAAASADTSTYLWDVAGPTPRLRATVDGPTGFAYSPAFSPDGRLLAVGSADRTVRLFDVSDPDLPIALGAPLEGPANYVYAVAFSPDGTALAAASTDGTVRTWDVRDPGAPQVRAVLTGPEEAVFSVAWTPDGTRLLGGAADRTVRVWFTDPEEAVAAICAAAGAPLTAAEWARHVPDLPFTAPC